VDNEQKEKLFGEVAVDLGFATNEDLERVIRRQKIDKNIGISKPIGAYFFEDGKLNRDQVDKILTIQEKLIAKIITNSKANETPAPSTAMVEVVTQAEKDSLAGIVFGELNMHVQKLQSQTDIQQIITLLHPDNFRQFLSNALINCLKIIEEESSKHGKTFNRDDATNNLMSESNYFRSFFDVFSNEYAQFQLKLAEHDKNVSDKAGNAGMVVGLIGSIFLGPLGAILGGALAGGAVGHQAKEALKAEYDHLLASYSQLCDHLNQLLTNVGNRTIHFIGQIRSGMS